MSLNIKCTMEEYERYVEPILNKNNKISLGILLASFIAAILFKGNVYVDNIIIIIYIVVVCVNIDIRTNISNAKKSLSKEYILIDDEMISYYTVASKSKRDSYKTYNIKRIDNIDYKSSYCVIYGDIDVIIGGENNTEEVKEVDFCRIPKFYKDIQQKLIEFKIK